MIYFIFFASVCAFYFNKEINECIRQFASFLEFMHENNPLLLDYYDNDCDVNDFCGVEESSPSPVPDPDPDPVQEPYENKYLTKFKNFTNDYLFNEDDYVYKDRALKGTLPTEMKNITIPNIIRNINKTKDEIIKMQIRKYDMENGVDDDDDDDCHIPSDPEKLKTMMTETEAKLCKLETDLNEKYEKLNNNEFEAEAHQKMIDDKLNGFSNNYIIEYTPVGNVIMRYNHVKQSFEYFSNHTVPYRYLETIGRKYVMIYKCKNIFIDLDEEVENVNKINAEKQKQPHKIIKSKSRSTAENKIQLKSKNMAFNANQPKPPTITNPINEVEIAIKNSNRYTCEGQIADFKIIKPIQKEKTNKKLHLSFKEFKEMNRRK